MFVRRDDRPIGEGEDRNYLDGESGPIGENMRAVERVNWTM